MNDILRIIFGFLFILFYIGLFVSIYRKNKKLKNDILAQKFISYKRFENEWLTSRKYKTGLKYQDKPGCYVILFFKEPVINEDYSKYENVYVGQSINMYQRVHQHFNGKGNGDVYADIKYGKQVYVKFIPCDRTKMNKTEKELISAFRATNSYNRTKGGSGLH